MQTQQEQEELIKAFHWMRLLKEYMPEYFNYKLITCPIETNYRFSNDCVKPFSADEIKKACALEKKLKEEPLVNAVIDLGENRKLIVYKDDSSKVYFNIRSESDFCPRYSVSLEALKTAKQSEFPQLPEMPKRIKRPFEEFIDIDSPIENYQSMGGHILKFADSESGKVILKHLQKRYDTGILCINQIFALYSVFKLYLESSPEVCQEGLQQFDHFPIGGFYPPISWRHTIDELALYYFSLISTPRKSLAGLIKEHLLIQQDLRDLVGNPQLTENVYCMGDIGCKHDFVVPSGKKKCSSVTYFDLNNFRMNKFPDKWASLYFYKFRSPREHQLDLLLNDLTTNLTAASSHQEMVMSVGGFWNPEDYFPVMQNGLLIGLILNAECTLKNETEMKEYAAKVWNSKLFPGAYYHNYISKTSLISDFLPMHNDYRGVFSNMKRDCSNESLPAKKYLVDSFGNPHYGFSPLSFMFRKGPFSCDPDDDSLVTSLQSVEERQAALKSKFPTQYTEAEEQLKARTINL